MDSEQAGVDLLNNVEQTLLSAASDSISRIEIRISIANNQVLMRRTGVSALNGRRHSSNLRTHQTLQTLSGGFTMRCPALHENACANSGMLTTTPLIRYSAGECGSVMARTRRSS